MNNIDEVWSQRYDNGSDYRATTTQDSIVLLKNVLSSAPMTCLDIGCGTGQLCRELFHRGYQTVGIDISKSAIRLAIGASVYTDKELLYFHKDAENSTLADLPFSPYGLIICKYVYAFISNKEYLLKNITSALGRYGTFVVITPAPHSVSKEKKSITIPHDEMLQSLRRYFAVDYFERKDDMYYICRNTN